MNEYSHTIDTKGRMILPAKFREGLGEKFILSPGLDACLMIYPLDRWEAMAGKLQKLSSTHAGVRQLRRFLIGKSTEMECDRQGRILIPNHLRAYANLEKEARVVGVGDAIEIWCPESADKLAEESGSIADIAESLDLPPGFDL